MNQPREVKTQRFSFVIKDKAPIDWAVLGDMREIDRQLIDDTINDVNASHVRMFGEDVAEIDAEYHGGSWIVRGAVQYSFQCQRCYAMTVPSVIARTRSGDKNAEICKNCGAKLDVMHEVELEDTSVHALIGRIDRELCDVYYRESEKRLSLDAVTERAERELNDILLRASPRLSTRCSPYSSSTRPTTENYIGLRFAHGDLELVMDAANVCSRGVVKASVSKPVPDSWLDFLSHRLEKSKLYAESSPEDREKLGTSLRLVREWRMLLRNDF
ncbi:hypothetical protein [Ferrimicrobium acidiphilum]|jgi:transcription elongation factor Elf1|uniref:hypothetical protein n=1 Tax=Ferrimicrobium acidiphilum TaxID=121039 RepID=UPI0023F4BF7F|nr:hypothetical protein [Ferrimicrobium acidiphilum]